MDSDIDPAAQKPVINVPLVPQSPLSRASEPVLIRPHAACTTNQCDPSGPFGKLHFTCEPNASVMKASTIPNLYNLNIYALNSMLLNPLRI